MLKIWTEHEATLLSRWSPRKNYLVIPGLRDQYIHQNHSTSNICFKIDWPTEHRLPCKQFHSLMTRYAKKLSRWTQFCWIFVRIIVSFGLWSLGLERIDVVSCKGGRRRSKSTLLMPFIIFNNWIMSPMVLRSRREVNLSQI